METGNCLELGIDRILSCGREAECHQRISTFHLKEAFNVVRIAEKVSHSKNRVLPALDITVSSKVDHNIFIGEKIVSFDELNCTKQICILQSVIACLPKKLSIYE